MKSLKKLSLAKWLTIIGFGVLGIIFLLDFIPIPTTIDTTHEDATIHFSANHWVVLSRKTCVNVTWHVEHIKEVYLNGEGVVGGGENTVCIDLNTQPALRVVFQDGSEKIYKLFVPILLAYPLVWILLITSITMLMMALGLTLLRLIHLGRRIRLVLQALAGTAVALALTLILIEIGLRLYYSSSGGSDEQFLYTASRDEIVDSLAHQYDVIAAPYVNYVLNPDYTEHDQLGYRGEEVAIPKPDGVYRIVVLGDSYTYGLNITSQQAYPAQIQKILRDEYGYKNVEVINGGVTGYSSWEVFTNLSFRVLELDPDLVIIYQNFLDIPPRLQTPDCYQGMNPLRGLNAYRKVATPNMVEDPSDSTFYRYLAVSLGWEPPTYHYDFRRYDSQLCQTDDVGTDEEHLQQNPPIYFRRNLRNMVAVAQANGVRILLSTQAYNRQTDSKFMADWRKAAADDQNRIIQDVATEMNASFYDLMGEIDQNHDYWFDDGNHPNPEGAQEYGRLFAAYLAKTGWLDTPVP